MSARRNGRSVGLRELRRILDIDADSCRVEICLASIPHPDADVPEYRRLVATEELAGEFRGLVVAALTRRRRDLSRDDLVLHAYSPESKLDRHEVEHLSLAQHQAVGAQVGPLSSPLRMDEFSESDERFIAGLRFYTITLRPRRGRPIHFFRTYTPKKELGRSKLFAVLLRQGHYDRFRRSLFLFDRGVDCACSGGHMFVFSKGNFHKIFRYVELLMRTAEVTLDIIEDKVPIEGFDEFRAACTGHLQKVAKLKNIAGKPYLHEITLSDLKRVIEECDLPIRTTGRGPSEKLVYDPADKWAILRLLDDDYLRSIMTDNRYEVNSKRPL